MLTEDARAAEIGLAQSDTSGAVPWNYKLANGHWLTPADSTGIWVDGRGGPQNYTSGVATVADQTIWQPDLAHQPNLNYVPYIMTGSRWNLDRLNAQAAFSLSYDWPGVRCRTAACDTVMNGGDQVRQEGWSMREIEEAAFIGAPNSFEQSYFSTVVADNWTYYQTQQEPVQAAAGALTGYMEVMASDNIIVKEWMDDYVTGVAVLGAEMGYPGAMQFVGWQKDTWLAGRFIGAGMNPYDGCNYILVTANTSGAPYSTWSSAEAATLAAGDSNGTNNSTNWSTSGGDYCSLARAVLGGALTLYPTDTNLQQALTWLNNANAPFTAQSNFRADPTFNVVPLQ